MSRKILTEVGIRAAFSNARKGNKTVWVSDGHMPKSHGGLQLRAAPQGEGRWYWRYSTDSGKKIRIPLGVFSFTKCPGALTLAEARGAAYEKAGLYQQTESKDVREYLEREVARAEAERIAEERARADAARRQIEADTYTLATLFDAYVAHLTKQGKQSSKDAANLFKNHVLGAHPLIAGKAANAVTARDIVSTLRPLTEKGKGRTAAKLRSYLRAAYSLAARAALDPDAPSTFLAFNVETNPVDSTDAMARYNRALDRVLTDAELRAYWAALNDEAESPIRDAFLLLLLLGGQRPAQLVRLTTHDVDLEAKVLRLRDPKGKRSTARLHELPLTEKAVEVLERCKARAKKQESIYLLSTHGKAPLRPETLSSAIREIAMAMVAAETVTAPFQLRDLRRTCETSMARMGISRDIRAQIQSHGLGGVQARHYDKHDYAQEKSTVLESWAKHLEAKPASNVTEFQAAKAA